MIAPAVENSSTLHYVHRAREISFRCPQGTIYKIGHMSNAIAESSGLPDAGHQRAYA